MMFQNKLVFLKQIVIDIICAFANIIKQDESDVHNILILKSQASCIYI